MSNKFNFTEKDVAKLCAPAQGSKTYYDSGSKDGLIVIVSNGGTKTYYSYIYFQGSPRRTKIGRVGDIKLIDARAIAHTHREQATKGEDPSAKRKEDLNDITLKQFYETIYRPEYSVVHNKDSSITNNDSIFNHRLRSLHGKRLMNISSEEIEKLHNKTKMTLSEYTANRMLSLIKHMYSIAVKQGYVRRDANPTESISKFPEKYRDRFLQPEELNRLMDALKEEPSIVFRNFILMLLYTGVRRNNALTMRWENIDLKSGFIYFPDSKSGESINHEMATQTKELLEAMKVDADSDWVFPSKKSASGHLEDPKRPWQDLLKKADIKNFRLHDLRRTHGCYQMMAGVSLYVMGKSIGHKSEGATKVYAHILQKELLESRQKGINKMFEYINK